MHRVFSTDETNQGRLTGAWVDRLAQEPTGSAHWHDRDCRIEAMTTTLADGELITRIIASRLEAIPNSPES